MNPSNKIKLSVLLAIAAFPTLSYAEDVQTGELPEVTVSGKRPAQSAAAAWTAEVKIRWTFWTDKN